MTRWAAVAAWLAVAALWVLAGRADAQTTTTDPTTTTTVAATTTTVPATTTTTAVVCGRAGLAAQSQSFCDIAQVAHDAEQARGEALIGLCMVVYLLAALFIVHVWKG